MTSYTGNSINGPRGIAAGPDGALWFANYAGNSIGRITTTGTVTNYTDPSIGRPSGIAAGPDGALWFTNGSVRGSIGRITTTGTVTNYTDSSISAPEGIVVGPDGALWFTNAGNSSIGRITTSGSISEYTDSSVLAPLAIADGPDGALWFTNVGDFSIRGSIGRITTTGTITNFTDPSISGPEGIAAGSDGALWFTNEGNGYTNPGISSIGRITTTGTITNYTDPSMNHALGITAGLDGALWFTNFDLDTSIGRITTTGTVTSYRHPSISDPEGIVLGPDGALWFTNHGNGSIGRIASGPPATPVVVPGAGSVLEGNAGTASLAVPVTLSNPSAQTVTVQWSTQFVPGTSEAQADPGSDYTPASGTVTFAPGETAKTVPISVNGDTLVEPDEYIVVSFHDPTNAKMAGYWGLGFGVITNDDHATVLPGIGSVVEGASGTSRLDVPVALSNPSTQTVTVQWTTVSVPGAGPNQADPATDYAPASGTVTFAPGETAKTVPIDVNGDTLVEPDEYIVVSFHNPTNAKMGGYWGLGFGVITNDD